MGLCGAIYGGCRESIDGCLSGCGAEGTTKRGVRSPDGEEGDHLYEGKQFLRTKTK